MKRIEFIAPVEAMRGNLSGKQDLLYAENNNKAFEGPVGQTNYARNYSPRFIGAKVAKTGKKYFTVRTKSANHLTVKAKNAMALLGGTGAIVGAILSAKSGEPYNNIMAQYIELQQLGENRTFRKYVSDVVRAALIAKSATIVFAGPRPAYSINNPWIAPTQTQGAEISASIVWKFAGELCANGARLIHITFTKPGTGEKMDVERYVLTGSTWADQILNAHLPLGTTSKVNGVLTGTLLQAPSEGQAQIRMGVASDPLTTVPVYIVEDEEEVAVMGTDTPSANGVYVAHNAA